MDKPTEQPAGFPIPRSHFSSDELPASDRFDAWSDSISPLFRPYPAPGIAPEACSIKTDAFLLGETLLGSACVSGVGGYRNPGSSPLRDAAEIVMIQYVWRGGDTGYNGAQALRVGAGDIIILDPTRGISLVADDNSSTLTFVVPRQMLVEALGAGIKLYPRVISGRSLPGQILGQAMLSAWQRLPQLAHAEAGAVSGLLVGAIAGMLRGGDEKHVDPAVDRATLEAICAYIERNLANPELGPEHLCRRFCCSRARLYRLFAPLDGVANYIRRARLERCHAALLSTARKVNVSDVALEWGFNSISHFTRLFRDTYGVSPGEIKGAAINPDASPSPSRRSSRIYVPEYRDWLEHL